MGTVEEKLGNFQNALDLYEKSLEIKIKNHKIPRRSTAQTYGNIANVYHTPNGYGKALFHYQHALEIFKKSLGDCNG